MRNPVSKLSLLALYPFLYLVRLGQRRTTPTFIMALVLVVLPASSLTWGQGSTSRLMCSAQTGNDMGAKIQACYNALPANGGVCDCTDAPMQGAQTAVASITCNKQNAVVLLGATGLTLNGGPWSLNANGCSIIGADRYQSWILTNSTTSDVLQSGAEKQVIEHVSIASAPGTARTAGAGINVGVSAAAFSGPGDGLRIDDVTIFRTWHGIWASGGSAGGSWTNITCFPNEVPGYVTTNSTLLGTGVNDCIQLGPVGSGSITGTFVSGVVADDNYNDAAIVVDSGVNSATFTHLNIGAPPNGNMTSIHVKNSLRAGNPSELAFINGDLEGRGTSSVVQLDACGSCTISNMTLGGGTNSVLIGANVFQADLNNDLMNFAQNQCIYIAGGLNGSIHIIDNTIGSCSQSLNNAFPDILAGVGVNGLLIEHNHFFHSILCASSGCPVKASNDILLSSGVNFAVISGNIFGDKNGNAVVNQSSGTSILMTGNAGGP